MYSVLLKCRFKHRDKNEEEKGKKALMGMDHNFYFSTPFLSTIHVSVFQTYVLMVLS